MAFHAPSFWWRPVGWRATILRPAAMLYGAVARYRLRNAPRIPVDLPILCVGNFTVGGSGKTPVAMALAHKARAMGLRPGILSRGHGSRASAARLVDANRDQAVDVGDEPLLLARAAPVAVSADRVAAARLLATQGCDFVIMDDGFQSARIRIDCSLLVVDAAYGIGNGLVLPAGPLRAPLADQFAFTDFVLQMGAGIGAAAVISQATTAGLPVLAASARPVDAGRFAGRRLLAFAGLGHPEKFFDTLRQTGAELVTTRVFPDHHPYTVGELSDLAKTASSGNLWLVTTAKDAARISGDLRSEGQVMQLEILEIEAVFEGEFVAAKLIEATLTAWQRRRSL